MPISLQARFWKIIIRKLFKEKRLTIEGNRARSASTSKLMRIPKGVTVTDVNADGLHSKWISPNDSISGRIILHLHGGGYVTGGADSHLMMCIPLAQTLKARLLLPEYRLAPEHPFPAAVDDAVNVYRWILAQGYSPKNIIISGDSAGGGLSLAAVQALRDAGDPLPAAIVCLSPWTDLTFTGRSHITKAEPDPVLLTDVLREWASHYVGKEKPDHPLISPIYADFHDFPPILIQVGSDEVLLDDAVMLAEKAKAEGVDVTLTVWDDLWHVWPALGDLLPESKKAFEEIGDFIDIHATAK
ncbi:MAG: alpha/beta hydrolase [Anaerolineales bacterium]|nr:alpha/beta hydrolase [Anaerolineales bacterium]